MITFDTGLIFRTNYYQLNTKRMNQNAYKSIDSYPEEHSQGTNGTQNSDKTQNTNTTQNTNNQTTNIGDLDKNEVIEALKLYLPENRLSVLLLLDHSELVDLLYLLQNNKLVLGLKFFNKKKLLNNIYALPKEDILKVLFKAYSKDEFLEMVPKKGLQFFLKSSKIEHRELMKAMEEMPKNLLAQVLESVTGKPAGNKSQRELLGDIRSIKQDSLVEGLMALPEKEMRSVVGKLLKNNEDLYMEFPKYILMDPLSRLSKTDLTESMVVLKQETLIKMLDELPNNLLAIVDTMIEPDKLTEQLQKYHSDLLSSLAA